MVKPKCATCWRRTIPSACSTRSGHLVLALRRWVVRNWRITGCGGRFPVRQAELFLGNAGTAFRPLTAALALAGGDYVLKGVARMHERPIGDLVDGLRQLGADVTYLGNEGYPPLAPQAGDDCAGR